MMNFLRDGGVNMYVMLATALAAGVFAATRARQARAGVLVTALLAVLVQGMAGLGTSLAMVAKNYQRFPNPMEALGMGVGEASNNATFAGMLGAVLGLAALVAAKHASSEK